MATRRLPEKQLVDENVLPKLLTVCEKLWAHPDADPFKYPVHPEDAPGYFDIIKKPMDLSTARAKVEDGRTKTKEQFHKDIKQITQNTCTYNEHGSEIYFMGIRLEEASEKYIEEIFGESPSKEKRGRKRKLGQTPM